MKKRVILIVVGILLVTSILIGISYAYYIFNVSQSGSNIVRTDCFEITYTDGNAISLSNAIPMNESEVDELIPYTFNITNVCNYGIEYALNIETLNDTTMDLAGVRIKLNNAKSKILGDIDDNDTSVIVNNNAMSSKTIKHGFLAGNSSKSFDLRVYIDNQSTYEQTGNKSFLSKVVVSAKLSPNYKEAYLLPGTEFNYAIKHLSDSYVTSYTDYTNLIEHILFSDTLPGDDVEKITVSDSSSAYPVYAWYVEDDDYSLFLYSEAKNILLNSDSSYLFYGLTAVDYIDTTYFDTSLVTNMESMFEYDDSYGNINFSNFDTSNVTNMSKMFRYFGYHSQIDLSTLDTSSVTNMSKMFQSANIDELYVSNFNTSKVTDMSYMFDQMGANELDVSSFDTSNVINMAGMFHNTPSLTSLEVSNFDTSKVTDMSEMFSGPSNITSLDLSNFDTSNVTSMSGMFSSQYSLQSLNMSSFDTSKVTDMSYMFYGLETIEDLNLSNFDTSNVENMASMFYNMKTIIEINIVNFDTSKVTDMTQMFRECDNLRTILVSDLWSTESVSSGNWMFVGSNSLVGGLGTTFDSNHIDSSYAHVDGGTANPGYLTLFNSQE